MSWELCKACDGRGKGLPDWLWSTPLGIVAEDRGLGFLHELADGKHDEQCEDCGGRGVIGKPDSRMVPPAVEEARVFLDCAIIL